MSEALSRSRPDLEELLNSPAWYRALTLPERLEALSVQPATGEFNRELAGRKLARWKQQKPFNNPAHFSARLEMDRFSEDLLRYFLGEPLETRRPEPPAWLLQLLEAYQDAGWEQASISSNGSQDAQAAYSVLILSTVKPLLVQALKRLADGVAGLSQKYGERPFDPETVSNLFFSSLGGEIFNQLSRTMTLEVNVARLQGRLEGATAQERFASFVRQLGEQGEIMHLFQEYPVLARQVVNTLNRWVNFSLEFLEHLCRDYAGISQIFSPGREPGQLVAVEGGAGDVHRGGRSVLKLRFSSGLKLVYKPKSMAVDAHFQELLAWLNRHGAQPGFRTVRILDRGTYGWSEFVEVAGCASEAEAGRFYERQGGYLALLYALEATDFHHENLIASGEHPVLIDLEALFHPRIQEGPAGETSDPAGDSMAHSVLRTALLPQRIWGNDESEGLDISGLGGKGGQLTPRPVPNWQAFGTDEMRLVRERMLIPASHNLPVLNGQEVDVMAYIEQIVSGFVRVYKLLEQRRDELLAGPLAGFAKDEIRVILRPTNLYSRLLQESFHPDLLRNALERDRFFDHLWTPVEHNPYFKAVIPAERADLLEGDIPMFTTTPDTRDLFTSRGERIPNFLAEPGLELVRRRFNRLDEKDLQQQVWFIRASFATLPMGNNPSGWKPSRLVASTAEATPEALLRAACAVGDRLAELAIHSGSEVNWVNLNLVNEREWRLLPAGGDLYNGLSGIILFLAYLGKVSGQPRYTTLARQAFATLQPRFEKARLYSKALGAFDGLSSFVYLLTHLGRLWEQPELLAEAEDLAVGRVSELIDNDEALDLLSGSAGCILALLALNRVRPSAELLAVAKSFGNHLLERATPGESGGVAWKTRVGGDNLLTGFSHGAAGIAYSLFQLAALTGDERFHRTALQALAYERSLFSVEKQNWPDLRSLPGATGHSQAEEAPCMTTWCHGAAGITLSRLALLDYVDDATLRAELETGLQTILREGFGLNHSLCHGDLGNLEVLLAASLVLNDPGYGRVVRTIAAMVLESIERDGWSTGIPLGVEAPGLMTGLAGIGYGLLRLAAPEQVAAVLLLAPPLG